MFPRLPFCGAIVFACCAVGNIRAAVGQDETYAQSKLEVAYTALSYEPIVGHGASTPLAKYLSEGREMEIALAPVSGTPVLAPVRLFVGSMVANLIITANRFEASVQPDPTRRLPAELSPQ